MRGRERVRDPDQELDALPPAVNGAPHPVVQRSAVDVLRDEVLAALVLARGVNLRMCG